MTSYQTSVFPDHIRQERKFSCLKKPSMSASGRACRDRKSLVMSAVFAFADPNLFGPFYRSTGGRLLNVYKLALGMTSDKGLDAFSSLSCTKPENISLPTLAAAFRLLTISGSMTSPVSNVTSSGPVSLKGLTTVPSLTRILCLFP